MSAREIDQVAAVFINLGATEAQARTMAAQVLKRADQLAQEREIDRLEALQYLLQVAIAGRDGRVYEGPIPGNGTSKRVGEEE